MGEPVEMMALKAILHKLITEQSEGEWDEDTIAKDVGIFTDALWPLVAPAQPSPVAAEKVEATPAQAESLNRATHASFDSVDDPYARIATLTQQLQEISDERDGLDSDVGALKMQVHTLTQRLAEAEELLRRVEKHVDDLVCYASDLTHKPNRLARDLRAFLSTAAPAGEMGK